MRQSRDSWRQDRMKEKLNEVPQSDQTDSFKEQVFIDLVGPDGHGSVKTFGGGVSTRNVFGSRSSLRNTPSSDAIESMAQAQVYAQLETKVAERVADLVAEQDAKGVATSVGVIRVYDEDNKDKKNRLMRIDELHKFSDGTHNDVRSALDDILKRIRMKILKDEGEDFHYSDTVRPSQSDKVLKLKNIKKDASLKLFKLTNQERYEHVGPKVTSSQDGKVYEKAKRDYVRCSRCSQDAQDHILTYKST
ncbi:hypothetical protein Tco_0285033 [Tanacetum coccineum]